MLKPFDYFMALLFAIAITSCASVNIPTYSEVTNSWVGFHIDILKAHWGKPTGAFLKSNGHGIYVYEISRTKRLPTIATHIGDQLYRFPAAHTSEKCNTYFEVDKNGIIVKTSHEGNACP